MATLLFTPVAAAALRARPKEARRALALIERAVADGGGDRIEGFAGRRLLLRTLQVWFEEVGDALVVTSISTRGDLELEA